MNEMMARLQAIFSEARLVEEDGQIVEVRTCEDCGAEYMTRAIGEYSTGGDLCRNCRAKADAESWKTIKAAGRKCDERIAMHMSMD